MQLSNISPHGYKCPDGASSIWYIFATHQEQAAFMYLFDVLFSL